jgi:hypothetical protein
MLPSITWPEMGVGWHHYTPAKCFLTRQLVNWKLGIRDYDQVITNYECSLIAAN